MIDKEIQEFRERDDVDEARSILMDKPNVHSTALGYKFTDGEQTDTPCIMAWVEEKVPESQLSDGEKVPEEVNGVPTDVYVAPSGPPELDQSPARENERIRPLMGGGSVGRDTNNGGSICTFVENSAGNACAVTAGHVVTDTDGNVVSTMYAPYEDTNQSDNNAIGTTAEYEAGGNDDYAFIELDDPSWATNEIWGLGEVTTVEEPSFDDRIFISGYREGILGANLAGVDVVGDSRTDYSYHIDNEIALGGMSGGPACWYDKEADEFKLFGMHVASNTSSGHDQRWATSIETILDETGATIPDFDNSPSTPSNGGFFEGTITQVHPDQGNMTSFVANTGGETVTRQIEVADTASQVAIETQEVTLDPLENQVLTFSTGESESVTFNTEDDVYDNDIAPWTSEWSRIRTDVYGDRVVSVDKRPGGDYVAALHWTPNAIEVYETSNYDHVAAVSVPHGLNSSRDPQLMFSHDGNNAFTSIYNSTSIPVYDTSADDPTQWSHDRYIDISDHVSSDVYAVAAHPSQSFVVASTSGGGVVYDYSTDTHVTNLALAGGSGEGVRFSPDGQFVAIGDTSPAVRIYEVGDVSGSGWNQVVELTDVTSNASGINWDQPNYFVAGDWNNTAYVYNWGNADGTGWSLETSIDMGGSLYSPLFSQDGQYLILPKGVGNYDGYIDIYDTDGWNHVREIKYSTETATSVEMVGQDMVFGDRGGVVHIMNTPSRALRPPTNLNVELQ